MGFTEVLTLIFVICKLTGVIGWNWWLVLLPEIIAVGLYLVCCLALIILLIFRLIKRKTNKR